MPSSLNPQTNPKSKESRAGRVSTRERAERFGHNGCIIWLTGLSGAGKSTVATGLERLLFGLGKNVCVLDGDEMRRGLCSDLGFTPEDRHENIRRVSEVARFRIDLAFIVIMAFISPFRADRDLVRSKLGKNEFVEVFVNAPLEVCEKRDPKGLYARARAGLITNFTGITSPYEPPLNPEIELRTDLQSPGECIDKILHHLRANKVI